jgi:hypothetical protein
MKTLKTDKKRKKSFLRPALSTDLDHVSDLLDEALRDTFPCSDPVAIGGDPVRDDASSKRR